MISIVKAQQNDIEYITNSTIQLIQQIGFEPRYDRVMLKPNIVDAVAPENPTITHPNVVAAIILALHEKGVNDFVIAENSGYFSFKEESFNRLIEVSGYAGMVSELKKQHGLNITIQNLEFSELIEQNWKYGTIKIPKICHTHSYINVAKMKTHMMTGVTLSLKNQKGLLVLGDKKRFHLGYSGKGDLHDCIKQFGTVIHPELNIVDATTALEGTGPAMLPNGQTGMREPGLLIGGTDMIEVDNACCKIMGIPVSEIDHLPEHPVVPATGSLPCKTIDPPFKRPDPFIKYENILQYCSEWGCTNCQMAFSRIIRKSMLDPDLKDRFAKLKDKYSEILFYIGKQEAGFEINSDKPKLFFGQCTKKAAEESGGIFVGGCPADHNEGIAALLKMLDD